MALGDKFSGVESTYTGATVPVRNLGDHIYSTDKDEYPFLKLIGLDSMDEEVFSTKYEWLRFQGMPRTDTVNENPFAASDTSLTVANSEVFKVGDIIQIENELLWVSAISYSTDTLTVTRGFAGTTDAAHALNTPITVIGNARLEGSSPGDHRGTVFDTEYNYTQIFDLGTAEVTGTEEAVRKYGVDSLMQFRIDQLMRKGYLDLERMLIYGRRYVGSATVARAAGGLVQYVTNSTNMSGNALTEAAIIDALESIWTNNDETYRPDVMVGNSKAKRKVTGLYAGAAGTPRNYDRQERVGGYYVETIETDFGTLDFVLDPLFDTDELWLLDTNYIMMGPLSGRAFMDMEATQPGDDKKRRRIIGEYTVKVVNPGALWLIYNFATA